MSQLNVKVLEQVTCMDDGDLGGLLMHWLY